MVEIEIKDGKVWLPASVVCRNIVYESFPTANWVSREDAWVLYATADTVERVNKVFKTNLKVPNIGIKEEDVTWIPFPYVTQPMLHQMKALNEGLGKPGFGYLMEPGLGKTKTIIDEAQLLNRDGLLQDVLVYCPKSVMGTWVEEIKAHGHCNNWQIFRWNPDKSPARLEEVYNGKLPHLVRWAIFNIDSARTAKGFEEAENWLSYTGRAMIVVDESTDIRNRKAQRTKAVLKLRKYAEYRRILTGSFFANTPMDAYSQLLFLDEELMSGWSWWSFLGHFTIRGGYKNKEIIGYRNKQQLANMISRVTFRATADECLDLPEQVFEIREVGLPKKTWSVYDQVCINTISDICDNKVTADQAITKMVKLRQITGGAVLDDDKKVVELDQSKIDEIVRIINEANNQQVLVWCSFRHDIARVTEVLQKEGIGSNSFYGGMSGSQRDFVLQGFKAGNYQVLVLQIDAGCMGLTLNNAKISILMSNNHLPMQREQLLRRNWRKGQTSTTVVYDLVVPGSVDKVILDVVTGRLELNSVLLGDPEALAELLRPGLTGKKSWRSRKIDRKILEDT